MLRDYCFFFLGVVERTPGAGNERCVSVEHLGFLDFFWLKSAYLDV